MRRSFATGLLVAAAIIGFGIGLPFFCPTAFSQNTPESPGVQTPSGGPAQLNLFFIGRRKAVIDTCGCKSKQQGGVQYEASLYDKYGAVPSVRLEAGEWTTPSVNEHPEEGMRTRYLLRALTMLGMDAVNVGFSDMQLSAEFHKNYQQKYAAQIPNFVSANIFLKEKPDQPAFPVSRIVKRKLANGREVTIGITGVATFSNVEINILKKLPPPPPGQAEPTQFESANYVVRQPKDCLAPVIAQLRPQVDLLVVLNSGTFASSLELAKAHPQIDYLITNGNKPLDQTARSQALEPVVQSYLEGKVHIFCVRNLWGKEVGMAVLAADANQRLVLTSQPQSLAVNKELGSKKSLVALLEEFKKETRSLDVALPGPGVKMTYAGGLRCQMCHLDQYNDWKASRHGHALQTLVDKGQEFNPDCLKCHTTGFRTDNGFYTVSHGLSKQMFDVQCEMCHGPSHEHYSIQQKILSGAKHWMKPDEFEKMAKRGKEVIPSKQVPAAVCLKCHTPENDDHFVYDEKVKKINHLQAKKK